ncbi:amino acid permease [Dichomitus squalens]|uniref:Amino acid permease n=1 Tax=Dichomitus squalens TaxID=114155 RepID=A0A4Q9MH12_9APHY|nr:amino acid permease [Dichomitus squalens]
MSVENEKEGSLTVRKAPESVSSDFEGEAGQNVLRRKMKNRHIAMIRQLTHDTTIGIIGTGLFLGTASALQSGGPVGMLLGYIVVGSLCYTVMVSLGEMAAFLPVPGGHLTFAERFVDPALSFSLGWLYWYNWTIILPAELSAASVVISYWNKTVNPAVWTTMCLIVVLLINVFGVGVYGEAEFIFASIKVITITGLIILGIVLDLGGGPSHDRIGFRYWRNPGPFVQFDGISGIKGQSLGFVAVMLQAAFSFIGTEVVAIAGAEVKNPLRSIPKAIRNVYIRLLLFYVGGVAIIGLLVPSTDERLNIADGTAAASPFVIAINNAGIKVLPSIINAVILTSAWSAGNSQLYVSSRALYGLALNGNAPKIFLKVTHYGLPWVALCTSASFALLAYMGIQSGSGKVFGWFANMCAVAGLSSWLGIAITYLRFYRGLRVQGIDRKRLPYRSPFQPFTAWYAAVGCAVVILFSGWSVFLKGHWRTDTFVTNYFPIAAFCVLYAGAKLWTRIPFMPYAEMDFKSGLQEVLDASYEEPKPRNWIERFWQWLKRRTMTQT